MLMRDYNVDKTQYSKAALCDSLHAVSARCQ